MNDQSSRSHCVASINLLKIEKDKNGHKKVSKSSFCFVDQAGSERVEKTGNEAKKIRIKLGRNLCQLGPLPVLSVYKHGCRGNTKRPEDLGEEGQHPVEGSVEDNGWGGRDQHCCVHLPVREEWVKVLVLPQLRGEAEQAKDQGGQGTVGGL